MRDVKDPGDHGDAVVQRNVSSHQALAQTVEEQYSQRDKQMVAAHHPVAGHYSVAGHCCLAGHSDYELDVAGSSPSKPPTTGTHRSHKVGYFVFSPTRVE